MELAIGFLVGAFGGILWSNARLARAHLDLAYMVAFYTKLLYREGLEIKDCGKEHEEILRRAHLQLLGQDVQNAKD